MCYTSDIPPVQGGASDIPPPVGDTSDIPLVGDTSDIPPEWVIQATFL